MKVAALADIHSNHIALQTAVEHINSWKPDYVVVAGDLINRGPDPLECINLLQLLERSKKWVIFRGNHEDYVIDNFDTKFELSEFEYDVHQPSLWTAGKLGSELRYIRMLPNDHILTSPDGRNLHFLHGSMISNRDGIYPETSDLELEKKITDNAEYVNESKTPAVFCVGHTHRPLQRYFKNSLVVNVGSIGLPFDGDNRICYAQLAWKPRVKQWKSKIVRLKYDLEKAEKRFFSTGYLENAGPLSRIVLTELHTAQSLLYYWAADYQENVLNGILSIEESVNEFLEKYVGVN
jgi:predicted phosphodiesterase